MAKSSGQQNGSSSNGSDDPDLTLYDKYQKTLTSSSEKNARKGKEAPSGNENRNQDVAAAAAGSNGMATKTQNSTGDGSSSTGRKKFPKSYEEPLKVRGFEYDERSLEMMLVQGGRGDSLKTIGVVGPPGVGKTTLCKFILKNERVKGSYDRMIWISLSEPPEKPKTVELDDNGGTISSEQTEDIIELISDERSLPEFLNHISQQVKEHKYLIVIDDVWEWETDSCYEALKLNFIDELPKEKGGAVIVTSRSEEAAKKLVGDKWLHCLLPLSDPRSCWLIYSDAVSGSETPEDSPAASKDAMNKLMDKSGGLPGAAYMMGKIKANHMGKK